MPNFVEFAEILEEKIKKQIYGHSSDTDIRQESDTDYSHLAYIMGKIDSIESAQPKFRKTLAQRAYRPYLPKPKPRPAHIMNDLETKAYFEFKNYTELPVNFNHIELKKAYRAAVKATHPDFGGNAEQFARVQSSHKMLMALLKRSKS